jgi:hypothetical protein
MVIASIPSKQRITGIWKCSVFNNCKKNIKVAKMAERISLTNQVFGVSNEAIETYIVREEVDNLYQNE